MGYLWWAFMNVIVTVVIKLFTSFAKRIPILLATVALIVSVTVTYLLAMHAVINELGQTIPDIVLDVWSWVMPGNAIQCLLAVLTARIIRWSYVKYEKMIVFKAKSLAQ